MSGDPFWRAICHHDLQVPPAVAALHRGTGVRHFTGSCDITCGTGLLARLVLRLAGFPPAGRDVPLRVSITTEESGKSEWRRTFGSYVTSSSLRFRPESGRVEERFGLITLTLSVGASQYTLRIGVVAMRLFGLPVPHALLPVSDTSEAEGPDGMFRFDVNARAPLAGFLIRYSGTLYPE